MKKGIGKTITGFTLAEVLITLTIIGVIAALTIPALIQNIQDIQYRTAWKKEFSVLNQAARQIATNNAGNLSGVFGSNYSTATYNNVRDTFLNYLNYSKKCDSGTSFGANNCWSDTFYFLNGVSASTTGYASFASAVLTNGASVIFGMYRPDCSDTSSPNADTCGDLFIDVNGFKPPNTWGKDIFAAHLLRNGNLIPRGAQGDIYSTDLNSYGCSLTLSPTTRGYDCSTQYLMQ